MKSLKSIIYKKINIVILLALTIFILSCEDTSFSALTIEEKQSESEYTGPEIKDYKVEVEYTTAQVNMVLFNNGYASSFWDVLGNSENKFECDDGETVNSITINALNSNEVKVTWESHNMEFTCELDGTPCSRAWYSQPCVQEFLTNCYYDLGTLKVEITISVTRK